MGAGAWGRNIVRTLAELGHLSAVCDPSSTCLEPARKLVGEGRILRWLPGSMCGHALANERSPSLYQLRSSVPFAAKRQQF